ncbi:hypothetical protein QVD17_08932 [Tagetes erecta]|uniref:TOG domain-containing protein n=1 Tax=Tagetes erecta TaxID=13708 RepID=A0AAD8KZZ6_TARER|nr:hypothetical protein QVD17_08932 [Tagetes erecta]
MVMRQSMESDLFLRDSNKDERERIVVCRFKFEELRLEQIQDLEFFREDLHRRLLSTDFKKQVDGIEMLQRALPTIAKDLIEVIDVLLKWFVLRFCESNTSCLLKTGHNIEKLREKIRELMKQIIHSYSAAKTLPYILEGLRSRNNRARIECADLVGFLLDNNGSEISGQLKSLQIVASLTAERDGELRKAALNCLATGYKIFGEVEVVPDSQLMIWFDFSGDSSTTLTPLIRRQLTANGANSVEKHRKIERSAITPTPLSGIRAISAPVPPF